MIFDTGGQIYTDSKLTLLWTNPEPEGSFATDSKVTLDVDTYPWLYIVSKGGTAANSEVVVNVISTDCEAEQAIYNVNDYGMDSRVVTIDEDGIVFGSGKSVGLNWSDNSITITSTNKVLIPFYIYGMSK